MIFCRKKRRKCPPCLPLNTVTDWSCLPTTQTGSMYALHTCGPSSSEGTESPPDVVDNRPHQCFCSCCLLLDICTEWRVCSNSNRFLFLSYSCVSINEKVDFVFHYKCMTVEICTAFHYDQLSSAIVT